MKKLIPETIENKIPSNKFVYYFTWLLVAFNFFRSLEHIFNDDGGAQSIAGIPLDFYIPEANDIKLSIFNIKGEKVRTIYDGYLDSGYQSMKWNGQNDNGATLPSGIYIMRLNYNNQIIANKMVKLK